MPSREQFEDYKSYVNKFKQKHTTDDTFTPPQIYNALADWVANEYKVDRANFVRPFYPGGDFENFDYKPGDIVVDNPPFSIGKKIVKFYIEHDIKFVLFTSHLSSVNHLRSYADQCTMLMTSTTITFNNGAKVNCSFVTNFDPVPGIRIAPTLARAIQLEADKLAAEQVKKTRKTSFPDNVLNAARLRMVDRWDEDVRIPADSFKFITKLETPEDESKSIFGGGVVVSDYVAEVIADNMEKAKAKAKAKAPATPMRLPDAEKNTPKELEKFDKFVQRVRI